MAGTDRETQSRAVGFRVRKTHPAAPAVLGPNSRKEIFTCVSGIFFRISGLFVAPWETAARALFPMV